VAVGTADRRHPDWLLWAYVVSTLGAGGVIIGLCVALTVAARR
jgi:hypothetical protein